jgi:hypothetical protein
VQLRPDTTDDQVFHVPPEEICPAAVLGLGCNIGLTVAHSEGLWPTAEIIGVDLEARTLGELSDLFEGGADSSRWTSTGPSGRW